MDLSNFCYLGDHLEHNCGQVIINTKYYNSMEDYKKNIIENIISNINKALEISYNIFGIDKFVIKVYLKKDISTINKKFLIKLINELEDKYSQKLQYCYIIDASILFKTMFKIISLFLNKDTKSKIKFIENKNINTESNNTKYYNNYF